jgi:hypothetical protein
MEAAVFLSVPHRVRGSRRSGMVVALLLSAMAMARADAPSAPPASAPSSSTSSAPKAPSSLADLVTEFQRLEAEAQALDPSSAEAVARLRELVQRLAHANAQLARDLAQLRAALESRPPVTPSRSATAGTRSPAGPARPQAARVTTGTPASPTAGGEAARQAFFAKRGLKKFHRAGCVFGERIKAEDRVGFADVVAAASAGLEPCKVCRPQ